VEPSTCLCSPLITGVFFEVVATNGDSHLGGEDFDQRVMERFIKLYKKRKGKISARTSVPSRS